MDLVCLNRVLVRFGVGPAFRSVQKGLKVQRLIDSKFRD